MATVEDVQRLLAATVEQLRAELAQRDLAITTLQAQVASTAAATPAAGAADPPLRAAAGALDTRLLGRPGHFVGGSSWRDWSVVFAVLCQGMSRPAWRLDDTCRIVRRAGVEPRASG